MEKEIQLVKEQTIKALNVVNELNITSDTEMLEAGNVLKRVKQVGKMIKDRKEEITKPMNEALKSVRSLFKPIEEDQEKALEVVQSKMNVYQKEQEALAEKIRLENLARLEQNHNDNKEVVYEKPIEVVKKSVDFHTRKIPKMRIIDEKLIPDEYWIIDEVKLRKDVVSGKVVPGTEYYEENTFV